MRLYSNFIRGIRLPVMIFFCPAPDRFHAGRKSLLQQPDVACDRDEVVAHLDEFGGLLGIDREPAGRLAVLPGGGDRRLLGLREVGMVEGAGLAQRD